MRRKLVSILLAGVLMTGITLYSASCACAQPVETTSLTAVHSCCHEGSSCASHFQTSNCSAEIVQQAVLFPSDVNFSIEKKILSKLDSVKAADNTLTGLELSPPSKQETYLRISVLLI